MFSFVALAFHIMLDKPAQKVNDNVIMALLACPAVKLDIKNNNKLTVMNIMKNHPKYSHLLKQMPTLRANYAKSRTQKRKSLTNMGLLKK